jgi:hypothetical protein
VASAKNGSREFWLRIRAILLEKGLERERNGPNEAALRDEKPLVEARGD